MNQSQHEYGGTVSVAGCDLSYRVEGAGMPLLVVGSSTFYPRTFSREVKESFTLVCADLPHFVRAFNGNPSFEFYCRCVDAIRSDIGFEQVVIIGHSHHGNVALEYAKRYPSRISAVVMIASPPADIASTVESAAQHWAQYASVARRAALERRRRALEARPSRQAAPDQEYVERYVADAPLYWYDMDYDATWLWAGMRFEMRAVTAFRDLFRDYRIAANIGEMNSPLLVVAGREDFAVPQSQWNHVEGIFPDITQHVLERCGHTPQLERAEAFDAILREWLERHI